MNALAPGLEFGMLCFENFSAGNRMFPVEESVPVRELITVVIGLDLPRGQALPQG